MPFGTHAAGPWPSVTPVKSGRATPTMVNGIRLRTIVLPTICGSRPSERSQKPWLMTATGVAWSSSSGRKPRPITGGMPSTVK